MSNSCLPPGGLPAQSHRPTSSLSNRCPNARTVRRGVQVLKMRGADHDKAVREFRITDRGMVIGEPFADVSRLL